MALPGAVPDRKKTKFGPGHANATRDGAAAAPPRKSTPPHLKSLTHQFSVTHGIQKKPSFGNSDRHLNILIGQNENANKASPLAGK